MKYQRGFTLVEVLIYGFVFCLIVIGVLLAIGAGKRRSTVSGAFPNTNPVFIPSNGSMTFNYVVTRKRNSDGQPMSPDGITVNFSTPGDGGCTVSPTTATTTDSGIIEVTVSAPAGQSWNTLEAAGPNGATGPEDRIRIEYGPE